MLILLGVPAVDSF